MNARYSLLSFWLCVVVLIAAHLYYPKWQFGQTEATISWDVSGYYFYLPALFVYGDLQQVGFRDAVHQQYNPAGSPYQAYRHESGNYVIKYSAGMAVQYLPFFLAAHALAEPLGYPADGFSRPYQVAISLGSLLVAFLGLWLLRSVLLRYFDDRSTAVTLLLIVLGTNYLNYAAIDGAMTHNYLFTLYALLLWLTVAFYRSPTAWKALGIGLTLGLMALTRPTEILGALLPLLWGIGSVAALRERVRFIGGHWPKYLLAAAGTVAVGSLQLLYWHYVTGDWIVYSYQDQGFSWLSPHIRDGLLSYRAGWLVYTPVMVFALTGFFFLYKKSRSLFWPVLLFSLAFMYVTWAWDIWWYGGSLGQRAMVQAYAVLAFPLAAFTAWVWERKVGRWVFLALVLLFSSYNLWLTYQAHGGGLFRSEMMTRSYFWKTLFRLEVAPETEFLLDTDEMFTGDRWGVRTVYANNFESDTAAYDCPLEPIEGSRSLCVTKDRQHSPELTFPLRPADGDWLRATATFRCGPKEWDIWKMTYFTLRCQDGDRIVKERTIRPGRILWDGGTVRVHIDLRLPEEPFDQGAVQLWNANGDKAMAMDELVVEVFEEE